MEAQQQQNGQDQQRAQTCRGLGILNRKQRKPAVAVAYFRQAAALDPTDHISLLNLAELFDEHKDKKHAIEYYMRAVVAAPQEQAYQQKFLELATDTLFMSHNDALQQALLICLSTPGTQCSATHTIWHRALMHDPHFSTVYKLQHEKSGDVFDKKIFDRAPDYSPLLSPYFLTLLKRLVIFGTNAFENFTIHLRRRLLESLDAKKKMFAAEGDYVTLAAALAYFNFATDYIFNVDKDEREKLKTLRARIESGVASESEIASYACYQPLYALKNAAQLAAATYQSAELAAVVRAQIDDYFDLQARRKSIVSLTEIEDAVSLKVREQYEEFPYPRWKALAVGNYAADEKEPLNQKGVKVLIAGAGTGQEPLLLARDVPNADVLAVDLSRSSLAYGMRKAEEYGMTNVTFRQGDILKLEATGLKFDCIASAGVLHHMKEPMKGWKVLCNLLKPDGRMRIALYSKHARKDIVHAREVIARENIADDADSMRQFRRKSPHLLDAKALERLQQFQDYYSLPMYRDLLFHVQEEQIDLPELARRLKELGLVFSGFSLQDPDASGRYATMFPGDEEGLDLARWDAVEKKYPDTFRNMYQFWCRKAA